ncbi:MAG: hypothetical protein GXP38_05050 [Chloroflexi bacterium]|nr:hypothetical protein [Chloroflexota bacterium]
MSGANVHRANRAAQAAGVKWPDGRKAFHDWLERDYAGKKKAKASKG